jgi:hypothetical protein
MHSTADLSRRKIFSRVKGNSIKQNFDVQTTSCLAVCAKNPFVNIHGKFCLNKMSGTSMLISYLKISPIPINFSCYFQTLFDIKVWLCWVLSYDKFHFCNIFFVRCKIPQQKQPDFWQSKYNLKSVKRTTRKSIRSVLLQTQESI